METRIYPINFEVKEIAPSLHRAIVEKGFCIIPTLDDIYKVNSWDLPVKFKDKSIATSSEGLRERAVAPLLLTQKEFLNVHAENSIIPSSDQEWWFICPQTQSQRICRKTPCGFSWKISGSHKDIKAGTTTKRSVPRYRQVFQDGVQTNWVICEYHLLSDDLNRNYVLCHLKQRQDEKADNSTTASEHGANYLLDLESYLHQPDHEDSFSESLIQARMESLIDNNESPTVMDFTLDNGHTDEFIQLVSETSKEDEDVAYMLFEDLVDADIFNGDQMETLYGQTSNLPNERPVIMENRQTQTINSLPHVLPLAGKKCMVENMFSDPLVVPKRSMVHPLHTACVKYNGKDEVLRFGKVRQETAAQSIKPESIYLDDTEARAKNGQIFSVENRRTRKFGSLHSVVPLEQNKSIIQSKFNSLHISSAKPMELSKKPKTSKLPKHPRIYINEEPRLEKVKKQEIALRNCKGEEHISASNSPRKKTGREIEHAREKANSVTAMTRPPTKGTKGSTNPPLHNLVNVLIGIFLLFAITCQVFNL
ncbi:hypothetical protein BT93_G0344 [Corymbia citriodora subsp. variegata]|nr:hypothetical protein BT93_G0344 [Corymbia citriodora subsp. variegata]